MEHPHPPRSDESQEMVALDVDAIALDVACGAPTPLGTWIAERMRAQSRTRDDVAVELPKKAT